jgi:hypothetical protein
MDHTLFPCDLVSLCMLNLTYSPFDCHSNYESWTRLLWLHISCSRKERKASKYHENVFTNKECKIRERTVIDQTHFIFYYRLKKNFLIGTTRECTNFSNINWTKMISLTNCHTFHSGRISWFSITITTIMHNTVKIITAILIEYRITPSVFVEIVFL